MVHLFLCDYYGEDYSKVSVQQYVGIVLFNIDDFVYGILNVVLFCYIHSMKYP